MDVTHDVSHCEAFAGRSRRSSITGSVQAADSTTRHPSVRMQPWYTRCMPCERRCESPDLGGGGAGNETPVGWGQPASRIVNRREPRRRSMAYNVYTMSGDA